MCMWLMKDESATLFVLQTFRPLYFRTLFTSRSVLCNNYNPLIYITQPRHFNNCGPRTRGRFTNKTMAKHRKRRSNAVPTVPGRTAKKCHCGGPLGRRRLQDRAIAAARRRPSQFTGPPSTRRRGTPTVDRRCCRWTWPGGGGCPNYRTR